MYKPYTASERRRRQARTAETLSQNDNEIDTRQNQNNAQTAAENTNERNEKIEQIELNSVEKQA